MSARQVRLLTILYDLVRVIGSEQRVQPLLERTVLRLLFHTGLPAGVAIASREAGGAELAAAVGSRALRDAVGARLDLPPEWERGPVAELRGATSLGDELAPFAAYGYALRLPVEGFGALVLLGPGDYASDLPLDQLFQPALQNLAHAVVLCRHHEAWATELTDDRDVARARLAATLRDLEDSRAALERAQAVARVGSYTLDLATGEVRGSRELGRILGVPPGAAVSIDAIAAATHPAEAGALLTVPPGAVGPAPEERELRILVDGEERWVHSAVEVMRDAAGHATSLVGTVQDITARKRADLARTDERELLGAVFEQAAYAILLIEADTLRFVQANAAVSTMLGWSRDELLSLTLPDIQATRSADAVRDNVQRILASGRASFPNRIRGRDGREIDVQIEVRTLRQRDRDYLLAIWIDTTERNALEREVAAYRAHLEDLVAKRTEELAHARDGLAAQQVRLQGAHDELRTIFDTAPLGIVLSKDGVILRCNRLFEAMLGALPGALEGVPMRRGYPDDAAYRDAVHAIRGRLETSRLAVHDAELVRLDGTRFRARMTTTRLDTATTPSAFLSMIEDVTAEHEAAEALRRAKEQAEAASRAKSTFLANMSHEIRTPMNAIIGLTHLLRRGSKDARQIEQLSKIGDAAQHLLAVINDILDLSKIEAGKLVVDASDFEVERVVVAVCELVRERAEAKGLDLVVDPGREPPAVRGDRLRLQQILLDFLANAVKFTERGRVSLRATTVDDGGGRVFVRFSVSDTGIGIAPEHLGRLFEPFEQADASTTRRHGGTGLGLAISSRLAELMGGRIGVESEVGRGSTFWIEVPLERAAPSRRTSSKPAGARPSSAPGDLERALRRRGGRVLLVEDNPINQEVATELLRSVGLEVEVASDGRAAVELAAGRAYDVILMDLQMPGMDGLAATRLLRAMPEHARTPILAMTASAFDDDRAACLAVGMDDHVAKPVEPDALFRALLDWMPARAGDRARGDVDAPPPTPRGADEGAALEAVAGLDVRGGLDRCGGNFALYARLLRRWSTGDDAEDVRAALALGDRAAARLSAHTRKGVAATLGIARVAELAGDVERLLARPADPSGHAALDDAIDLLRAEESEIRARIVAALHTVDAAAGPTPPPTADVDPIDLGAARAHLAELAALLDADDVRAVKVFHEHEETIARAIGAKAAALGRQIAAFAFQEAAVTVREAMEGDSRA